jgi:CubicO group peptidase (beta-lactamase class C family)
MQPTGPALDQALLGEAVRRMETFIEQGLLHGAALAAGRRAGLVAQHAAGLARWDGEPQPVRPDTIFAIASITKPIVATAIMQLVERGLLLVNDPVAVHIPEFGCNGKGAVTVKHLLTHTSGLDESYQAPLRERGAPREEFVRGACASFIKWEPGTRYEYCNASFWVLGELIERLSGARLEEYLRRHVFEPLGMRDTGFTFTESQRERISAVAADQPEQGLEFWLRLAEYAHPAGGLFSTAHDLVQFGRAFLNGGTLDGRRLLSPPSIAAMTENHTPGLPEQRGLGWALRRWPGEPCGAPGYGHGGATGTQLRIYPELDLVAVFLANRTGLDDRVQPAVLNPVVAAASA